MSKVKTVFQCQSCGYTSPKWLGRCPDCGNWNTFVEEQRESRRAADIPLLSAPVSITDITVKEQERLSTGFQELDRVLGGGIVPGSLVLVGGDPGIGKSTIMLQMIEGIFRKNVSLTGPALYVSGEESLTQIKMRSKRL